MSEEAIGRIIRVNIDDEMRSSYLDYAMSVIIGRALPDVRDGLKPVHRRVLYTMFETGNKHNAPFKKSARIVGDVMGKYHPHGDAAIYDTIVRMAQDFNMRYVLVDGQGNFGSIDGDAPAAMRYTEIRLNRIAEEMLFDIEKDTVDMVANYDGSLFEPSVLPTRVPNLLINGSSGIAVGMSTNIPTHNLGEVIDATIALIRNHALGVRELMQFLPGPDFPTGGFIQGVQGIIEAYETGRGYVKMKAKAEIEEKEGERAQIVITEIPYQVNKAKLLERIAELCKEKRVEGVHDLRDESDREGMRIVIELKKDADPRLVLNQLYEMTALRSTFNVIMLAIVRGRPMLLNLKQVIEEFINHRKDVVTRRTIFELKKAQEHEHILLGYKIALDNLDEIIALIRSAKDGEEARKGLCENFSLSEQQAKAILDLKLERLTRMERRKIFEELEETRKLITRLKEILASEKVMMDVIVEELLEIKRQYGDARKTQIIPDDKELSFEDLVPDKEMVVTVSAQGFIKRTPTLVYRSQKRAGKGQSAMGVREDDYLVDMFVASTHSFVLFFSNKGRVFKLRVFDIPEGSRQSKGRAIVNLLNLAGDEVIKAILPLKGLESDSYLVFATKRGLVKRTPISEYENIRANGITAIRLDPNDDLIAVRVAQNDDQCLLFSRNGMSIRFSVSEVRPTLRASRGVRGMRQKKPKDEVVGMEILRPGLDLLCVTERGIGKRTPESEYRLQRRGGTGILAMRVNQKVGYVVGMRGVREDEEVMLTNDKGHLIRLKVADVRSMGRVTQGVRLMNLSQDERLVAIEVIAKEENGKEEGEGSAPSSTPSMN
jgi:DNA gyrase subunit A